MACVLPVLLSIVLGCIEFTRLGMGTQLLANSAREACRTAAITGNTLSDVQARVNATLAGSGIQPAGLTAVSSDPGTAGSYIIPANWDSSPGGTPITVVIRLPYRQFAWFTPIYLSSASAAGNATFSSERP
jgi:Flp pilus assembly protein TadG